MVLTLLLYTITFLFGAGRTSQTELVEAIPRVDKPFWYWLPLYPFTEEINKFTSLQFIPSTYAPKPWKSTLTSLPIFRALCYSPEP